jgi:hypothetical protein
MWTTPELKLGLCGKKLAYNCLRFGVLHRMSKGSGVMVEVKIEYQLAAMLKMTGFTVVSPC